MGKIVNIWDYIPTYTGELLCLMCGYRFIGTWKREIWLRELYCDNCQRQGGIIATGQILNNDTNSNTQTISKPGQILNFPGEFMED